MPEILNNIFDIPGGCKIAIFGFGDFRKMVKKYLINTRPDLGIVLIRACGDYAVQNIADKFTKVGIRCYFLKDIGLAS